ncbi:hypothetical protein CFN78_24680 [Amycolatopsis antarctica]|uniref:Peptidase C39-like domain-containing protein n=1 Tax=Amycolatopsis antarctica TaxID=1854586 RepID=A0A263CWS5_9PSEU|nr:peptidase C39 family protein [Amycolatopsis antarctica]OZM70600.1 hypothetical protein CFN78_24680 [Amycolatopsis antarctica]
MRGRLSAMTLAVVAATAAITAPATGAAAAEDESIDYHQWTSADFSAGELAGVTAGPEGVRIGTPIGTVDRTEAALGTTRTYEYGQWTSPGFEPGFDASELIASWNAATPPQTWIQVEAKAKTAAGADTSWYILGQWADGDGEVLRTSVDGQDDANAAVSVDTLTAKPGVALRSYQLRVSLYREVGTEVTPTLTTAGAMTSQVPARSEVQVSPPGPATGKELPVPRHSQNIHAGKYPEYGGGGEAWCSPTSTQMVVEFWGKGPSEEELSWIPGDYVDRTIPHAARYTYDHAYDGTGNWPFNTAYAARYGLKGHITRLHSLTELESYIDRGVPVITSQSFLESELDGAGYGTAGHIMVVVGFTENGDVIANDPASSSNEAVRNVYPRAQFETIWQRTKRIDENGAEASGPGGIAYIIEP